MANGSIKKRKTARENNKKEESIQNQHAALKLAKYENNPIISGNLENAWEAWQTYNPGVILLDDQIHFIYRAIGPDGLSRLGYAVSDDGFTIAARSSYPAYQHQIRKGYFYASFSGGSFGGAEDPRLCRVDDEDVVYMTYTACDGGLRVALTSISIEDFLKMDWNWKKPVLISAPGETHKNWVIFPEKIRGRYAILHSIKPSVQVEYLDTLEFDDNQYISSCHAGGPQEGSWDTWLRGAAAPPLKTKDGWLLLYHAMDNDWGKYKVGALLLDLEDPTQIRYRAAEPVLEPSEEYENNGYKSGVIYVTGAIIKGDTLLVYYGGADSYVCVASAPLDEFLDALKHGKSTKVLKSGTLLKEE